MKVKLIGFCTFFLWSSFSAAERGVEVSAYGTIALGKSTGDSVYASDALASKDYESSWRESYDTRFAAQAIAHINNWSFTAQAITLGKKNYDIDLEWAFLKYQVADSLNIKAGRFRRPIYYYSDSLQVGYTYPWVRPPEDLYSGFTAAIDAIDGLSVYYESTKKSWTKTAEVYYGEYDSELSADGIYDFDTDFTMRDNYGLAFSLSSPSVTYRIGYHNGGTSRGDIEAADEGVALIAALSAFGYQNVIERLQIDLPNAKYFHSSVHVDKLDWLFNAEYSRIPKQDDVISGQKLWYVMGGKRFDKWTAHYTYSEKNIEALDDYSGPIRTDSVGAFLGGNLLLAGQLNGLADVVDLFAQSFATEIHRHTIGVRYDFDMPLALKAEVQRSKDDKNRIENTSFILALEFIVL